MVVWLVACHLDSPTSLANSVALLCTTTKQSGASYCQKLWPGRAKKGGVSC